MNKTSRRIAVLATTAALPIVIGSALGATTAAADPWHVGPVYRAETTGEGAQYFCSKAQALEQSSQSFIVIPCTEEAGVWYRVVVNPYNWALSF